MADFRAVMETNYFGALRCIQALAPHMRQRRSGCIINVSSVAGRIASAPLTSYMASKWALEALERGTGGRDEDVQCPSRDCRTRHHRYSDGAAHWRSARTIRRTGRRARFALLFEASLKNPAPPSLVGTEDRGNRGEWNMATPPSSRTRRRSLPAMAQWNDGRAMGGTARQRRRNLVPPYPERLRHGYSSEEVGEVRKSSARGGLFFRDPVG